jgi:hypothetical protein
MGLPEVQLTFHLPILSKGKEVFGMKKARPCLLVITCGAKLYGPLPFPGKKMYDDGKAGESARYPK